MGFINWVHRIVGNDSDMVVENTGDAVGENAVTGFSGELPRGARVVVRNTGNATATGGGSANSGIDYREEKKR